MIFKWNNNKKYIHSYHHIKEIVSYASAYVVPNWYFIYWEIVPVCTLICTSRPSPLMNFVIPRVCGFAVHKALSWAKLIKSIYMRQNIHIKWFNYTLKYILNLVQCSNIWNICIKYAISMKWIMSLAEP